MLTVLIATYNGAGRLVDVLNSFCKLDEPNGGWQLIIVDNGSADNTKYVIESFCKRLPVTYLYEPRKGKNAALNSGLPYVSGDLVVFTDDDVLPRPDWLKQLRIAADAHNSYAIFGGVILPKWQSPPEDWILNWVDLGITFAISYPADEGPYNPQFVWGPNMAIRSDIFQEGYRFNENVGPNGKNYASGGETEFVLRLSKDGFKSWHCKSAVVDHMVQSSNMTQEWALDRAVRFGRMKYLQENQKAEMTFRLFRGVPLALIIKIFAQRLRIFRAWLISDAEQMFKARWELNCLMGRAKEVSQALKK